MGANADGGMRVRPSWPAQHGDGCGSAGSPGNAVGAASAAYSKVLWGVLIVLLGVLGSLLYVLMLRKTLVGPTSEPAARTAY